MIEMDTRLGVLLSSVLLVATGACATSGSTAGAGSVSSATLAGAENVPQGEMPRETEETEQAADLLNDAMSAEENGDAAMAQPLYEQAADLTSAAIFADPTNPLAWYQGGLAQIGLEDYAAADSMLARAVELRPIYQFEIDPLREQTWIELYEEAIPFVNSGQYDQGAMILRDANDIYRDRPEVMLILGKIYAQQGQADEAVAILRQAMEIVNSDLRESMDSLSIASWDDQAEDVPAIIAQTLINVGRYDEAAVELRALLEEDPENTIFKQSLASIYVQLEMPDSAMAVYDDILSGDSVATIDFYQAGLGLYQLDLFEPAAEAFHTTSDRAPLDRDAAEMWARSLQLSYPPNASQDSVPQESLEELVQASERWLELDPMSNNAHIILAQTENRLGNVDRARDLITAVDALPIHVDQLQLQRLSSGGGALSGVIRNNTAEPNAPVTINVTFFGAGETPLGDESVTIGLPPQDATQVFQVPFESEQEIAGYTYTIEGI
jgi:tetratricopeptide (TPR) repeat protein